MFLVKRLHTYKIWDGLSIVVRGVRAEFVNSYEVPWSGSRNELGMASNIIGYNVDICRCSEHDDN